jgi:hypothetical protein
MMLFAPRHQIVMSITAAPPHRSGLKGFTANLIQSHNFPSMRKGLPVEYQKRVEPRSFMNSRSPTARAETLDRIVLQTGGRWRRP